MLLFSLHVFVFFLVNSPEWSHVSEQEDLSGPCHRGEEQFKGTHTEEGWRAEAEDPPLLLDPVLGTRLSGRTGQCFGARWLQCKVCKPCSASCVLFLEPARVCAFVYSEAAG